MRHRFAFASVFGFVLAPSLSACSGDDGAPCEDIDGRCIELSPSDDDDDAVQTALIEAEPDDVILLHGGVYRFERGLSLDVDDVTLRGDGEAETVLSFADQIEGAQGLLVTADGFTAENLAIEDTDGDGIKVEGGARVVFRGVRMEWSGGPDTDNGAYGLYPVQCTDVLIEDSIVRGASDAGIYVGQSERVVVRDNVVEANVAGIEIENTFDADVYENTATTNTGGILVFNLPGLQVANGARTRVFDNEVFENNQENFAAAGNTVAMVPPGTGFVAMAAHEVEVFGNRFANNETVQLSIISYQITATAYDDDTYDPYSDTLFVHDNVFEGGGDMPSGLLGDLVSATLNLLPEPPENVPDIVIDGNFDPEKVDGETGQLLPEFAICLGANQGADFLSLGFTGDFTSFAPSMDPTPYDCEHESLPAVELDGVQL